MGELVDLAFQPGLYTNSTDRSARGRWRDADHVRWHNGLPEKLGGWVRHNTTAFNGVCRGAYAWADLDGSAYAAAGTHTKLYAITGEIFNNITPLRTSGASLGTDPFTMTDTSAEVAVNHSTHGATAGDTVIFSGATAAHGITIDGAYVIDSITDADNYVITHSSAATSSGTGGGASVTADYELNIGQVNTSPQLGWGSGTWGTGTWGTPRTSSGVIETATIWSFDQWGEDLIACKRDGGIYTWDTSAGTSSNRATLISNAPTTAKLIKVADERILIAYGAHDGSNDDPMNVRWSDQEDNTQWTPATSNRAGSQRLDRGSEIIGAASARGGFLVFTDRAVYRQQFIGGQYVFSFQIIAETNRMLIGPNAAVEVDGVVYFMGADDFYVYESGVIRKLACDVWETVFRDLYTDQGAKVFGGHNHLYNEVWWFYSSDGADENDRYVVYNYTEDIWYFGTMERTAWLDTSKIFAVPAGFNDDGYLYLHESGYDAHNDALEYHLESYDAEIGQGDFFLRLKRLIPDYATLIGHHSVVLKTRRYPAASQSSSSSYTFTSSTEKIDVRVERGREAAIRLSGSAKGTHFRMAPWRAEIFQHGKR